MPASLSRMISAACRRTVGTRPLTAFTLCFGDAFLLPFQHGLSLSLANGTDDRQHQAAGRRARVERLRARHRQDEEAAPFASRRATTPCRTSVADRFDAGHRGAEVDDAPAIRRKMLDRLLCRQENSQHIDVEILMEIILCDSLDQCKVVDASVVHQNIDTAKGFVRISEQMFDII